MNETPSPVPPPPPDTPPAAPAAWAAPPPPWTAPAPPLPLRKQPAVAGVLSMFPGIGHLYLGLYQRAAVFFAVFVALIAVVDHSHGHTPLGLLIPFWWFFVLIDAVRQAKAINLTGAPESNLVTFEKDFRPAGNLGFGIFLVLVGIFFLLDRWVKIDLSVLADNWMVVPIAFGAWLIWSHLREKK